MQARLSILLVTKTPRSLLNTNFNTNILLPRARFKRRTKSCVFYIKRDIHNFFTILQDKSSHPSTGGSNAASSSLLSFCWSEEGKWGSSGASSARVLACALPRGGSMAMSPDPIQRDISYGLFHK